MTLAAIEDSRQIVGVLTLDGDPFQKQITECTLVPSVQTNGDRVEVLSGAVLAPEETYEWALNLGFIQDFVDAQGLVMTLRAKAGSEVPFTWQPSFNGPEFEGVVRIRPTGIGGAVRNRLTGTVELPVLSHTSSTDTP